MAKHAVRAPLLGELHHGARQIAVELLQLGLKACKKGEGVRGGTRKSSQNFIVIKPSKLLGGRFEHFAAQRYLAITGHYNFSIPADAQNGSRSNSSLHAWKFQ